MGERWQGVVVVGRGLGGVVLAELLEGREDLGGLLGDQLLAQLAQLHIAVELSEAAAQRRRLLAREEADDLRRLEGLGDGGADGEAGGVEVRLEGHVARSHLRERVLELRQLRAEV